MTLRKELEQRSQNSCELCKSTTDLNIYNLPPATTETIDTTVLICTTCKTQIENSEQLDANHWRCLNDSMWSEHTPVQVVSWRMLTILKGEGWPQDLLDMMYLDDETLAFAKAGITTSQLKHVDSNGNVLQTGDTVVLIKDLDVKGSSITAKRGTSVRNIRLDRDHAEYIEGKVDGQQIVILAKYVKKA